MDTSLPLLYLSALVAILGVVGWLVLREVRRVRRQEGVVNRLQAKLLKGKGTPQEHYELGSVYLEKRIYDQAIAQFKKGLEVAETGVPLIHNALGFTYFTQGQYDLAIRAYKEALQTDPNYVTAWNNLGHAYEKKNLVGPGLEAYEAVLALAPSNETAKRRAEALRKRIAPTGS